MPSHRISARVSRWITSREGVEPEEAQQQAQENTPPPRKRRHAQTTSLAPSSILKEITNSTRPQNHRRRAAVPVFEDPADRLPVDDSAPRKGGESTLTYHSHTTSAPAMSFDPDEDAELPLQERSLNAQSPLPLSSPWANQAPGQVKIAAGTRKSSYEASDYINHLEDQLAATQESLISPQTGKPIQSKIKTLGRENKRLRHLLEEWEDQFDARVKEAVEYRAMAEIGLYRKIKILEDEIVQKDDTIQELETMNNRTQNDLTYLDSLRHSIEKLQEERAGLENTNRCLERRNDILTELLAQSPTRADTRLGLSSPTRERPTLSTPRAQSMLPRVSPSPRPSLVYRPLSMQLPLSETPESRRISLMSNQTEIHRIPSEESAQEESFFAQSPDSATYDTQSIPSSATNSASQRSSLVSQSSGTQFPLPLFSPDGHRAKRRSRRFAPGSTTLKPLVLAALNSTNESPASSPPDSTPSRNSAMSFQSTPARHVNQSARLLSPTDAFDTPTQPRRQSSEEALRALEGNNESHYNTFEEVLAKHGCTNRSKSPNLCESNGDIEAPIHEVSNYDLTSANRLIAAEDEVTRYSHPEGGAEKWEDNTRDSLTDRTRNDPGSLSHNTIRPRLRHTPPVKFAQQLAPISSSPINSNAQYDTRVHSESQDACAFRLGLSDKKAVGERPYPATSVRHEKSSNLSKSTTTRSSNLTTGGTIGGYACLFRQLRKDPTAIARRVIANAWQSNWKLLGRLSWWVLGLFLGRGSSSGDNGWSPRSVLDVKRDDIPAEARIDELEGTAEHQTREIAVSIQESQILDSSENAVIGANHDISKDGGQYKKTWRRSIYLWGKFSFAIMLAVGGALVKGPGEMLGESENANTAKANKETSPSQGVEIRRERDNAINSSEQREDSTMPNEAGYETMKICCDSYALPAFFEGHCQSPDAFQPPHRPSTAPGTLPSESLNLLSAEQSGSQGSELCRSHHQRTFVYDENTPTKTKSTAASIHQRRKLRRRGLDTIGTPPSKGKKGNNALDAKFEKSVDWMRSACCLDSRTNELV
ncbi:MAG: hypothetical protein Q9227_000288 [Pyrenula ochraceoflavens]